MRGDESCAPGARKQVEGRPRSAAVLPVLHRSANGLVVVTAGVREEGDDEEEEEEEGGGGGADGTARFSLTGAMLRRLVGVTSVAGASPSAGSSRGAKRKRQARMLRGKGGRRGSGGGGGGDDDDAGVVRPGDAMAVLDFIADGGGNRADEGGGYRPPPPPNGRRQRSVLCGVWGTVLEVNANLSPELMRRDPALDGFLAIVLPTGPFPPPGAILPPSSLASSGTSEGARGDTSPK
jgi:hypothetical protein